MKPNALITRRKAIVAGLAGGGGLLLSGCGKELPPTYGNILRMADVLTYMAHRTLLPGQSLAREYSHKDISSFPATGTTNPAEPGARFYNASHGSAYERLREGAFAGWPCQSKAAWPGRELTRSRTSSGSPRGRRSPGTRARKAGRPSASGPA